MYTLRQSFAIQHGTHPDGTPLKPHEREALLKNHLPDSPAGTSPADSTTVSPHPSRSASRLRHPASSNMHASTTRGPLVQRPKRAAAAQKPRRKPIRTAVRHAFFVFVFNLINLVFGVWLRLRKAYRSVAHRANVLLLYHHRTPELIRSDIKSPHKMPQHVSVILQLDEEEDRRTRLHTLVKNVAEVTAWAVSAGIPVLSVYEKTGVLKQIIPQIHPIINKTLENYFSQENCPGLSIRAPNEPSFSPPTTPPNGDGDGQSPSQILLMLISEVDGRSTMVDLTKVMANMAQKGKLAPVEINAGVVDAELKETVMDEPQLLVLFTPQVTLDGYPPWQIRLTEIFHLPDHCEGVSYSVFMQALNKYSAAQQRYGK